MARNEEKAKYADLIIIIILIGNSSMLYRFRKAHLLKARDAGDNPTLLDPTTCDSINVAVTTRRTIFKDISRKVARIHDEDLDDESIRSLNDEINRLVKTVKLWNACLLRLGYQERDKAFKWGDERHPEPENIHGYYYFGRAKTLPGVSELLRPPKAERTTISPHIESMQKNADEEYFGVLAPEEEEDLGQRERNLELELVMRNVPLADWITGLPVHLPAVDPTTIDGSPSPFSIPTPAEIEEYLLRRRKQELWAKYGSDTTRSVTPSIPNRNNDDESSKKQG